MKETVLSLSKYINAGLVPNHNKRNLPFLVESIGALPFEKVIQAVSDFTGVQIDYHVGDNIVTVAGDQFVTQDSFKIITELGAFPYPQIWVLSNFIVLGFKTAIMEIDGASITGKIDGLPEGGLWTLVDFYSYLYMSNGVVAVTKDPASGEYSVNTDLPIANAAVNFNGQVILGGLTSF